MQYYVNIENSYDGTGGSGTSLSPWDWDSFIDHLSGGLATDNKTYYLSGDRVMGDSLTTLIFSNAGNDTYKTGNSFNIVFAQWPIGGVTPWSITLSAESSYLELSGDDTFDTFVMQDGRIQCHSIWLKNTVTALTTEGGQWSMESMWINAQYMYSQEAWNYGVFNGSTVLLSGGSNSGFYLQQDSIYLKNTIFIADVIGFPTGNGQVFIESGVLDREESDFCANLTPTPYFAPKYWTTFNQDPQEDWTPPAILFADVVDITSSAINYLSADWNSITATGVSFFEYFNSNVSDKAGNLYGGRRDGVGALYFPETFGTVSADTTSGYYDEFTAMIVSLDVEPAAVENLTVKSYYAIGQSFGQSNTTATSAIFYFSAESNPIPNGATYKSTKPFQSNNEYEAGGYISSPNGWYQSGRLAFDDPIMIYDYPLSADIFPANASFIEKTTFRPGDILYYQYNGVNSVSGETNLSGAYLVVVRLLSANGSVVASQLISAPDVTPRNGSFGVINEPGNYIFETWVSHKTAIPEQELYNNATSAAIIVTATAPITYDIKYVDIDILNDANTGNDGLSATPLCWSEFIDQIKVSGTGTSGTVYRLKGLRDINSFAGSLNILTADDKHFTIQDWDLSAYGPWVFVLNGQYSLDFSKVIVVNGMIYTKPTNEDNLGGSLVLGPSYDMYVVENGTSGTISFAAANGTFGLYEEGQTTPTTATFVNDTYYAGCTFFASGGFTDVETDTAYNLYLQDCVFENFVSADGDIPFLSATVQIDSCTFAESSAAVQGIFQTITTDGEEQYDWTSPSDWPLKVDGSGFGETLLWIINNRNKFAPFNDITRPPNPGINAPIYSKYKTGLFGYDRATYVPISES